MPRKFLASGQKWPDDRRGSRDRSPDLKRNRLLEGNVTMKVVRTFGRTGIAAQVGLACLAILGMSGNSITTLVCSQSRCGKSCRMHVPAPVERTPRSCCSAKKDAAKAEPQTKESCSCEIRSIPDAIPATIATVPMSPTWVAALPQTSVLVPQSVSPVGRRIEFFADSSPPIVFRHPDRGRAPPAA